MATNPSSTTPAVHDALSSPHRSRAMALGVATIALATCMIYWPAIHGNFILDDDLLLENDLIKDRAGLYRMWFTTDAIDYWPVTNTLFWIEWRVWGANPLGYHLVNLSLHIAATLLVWAVLQQLLIPGAFLAALLFTLHPVNVESVAWISQLKTILATVFFLLSIFCYLKESRSANRTWGTWYWLSFAVFVLGMLSKASVATLPAVLLLIAWWQHGRVTRQDVLRTAPFFLVLAPLVLVNMWFQQRYSHEIVRSFAERLAGAGAIPWFYLYKALWPLNLAFIYPLWEIDVRNPVWWLPLVASIAVTVALWRWRHIPWIRAVLFAWAYYWLALAPVLGFADVSYMKWSLVADHYQYASLISIVALGAAAWSILRRYTPQAALAAAAIMISLLAILSWRQSQTYRDAVTLYRATIQANPAAWMAMNNLGNALVDQGHAQEALAEFNRALSLKPDDASAYYSRANALLTLGRAQEAIADLRRSLELKPDWALAHFRLGNALLDLDQAQQAIAHFEQAIESKPEYAEAHNNLASALRRVDRLPAAIEHLRRAVEINPDYTEAWANLAATASDAGRRAEAIAAGQQALRLARAQGKTVLADELEAWLTSSRAGAPSTPPTQLSPALPPSL